MEHVRRMLSDFCQTCRGKVDPAFGSKRDGTHSAERIALRASQLSSSHRVAPDHPAGRSTGHLISRLHRSGKVAAREQLQAVGCSPYAPTIAHGAQARRHLFQIEALPSEFFQDTATVSSGRTNGRTTELQARSVACARRTRDLGWNDWKKDR